MIPAIPMYVEQLRSTWKKTLAVTAGVALTKTLVTTGLTDWKALPERFVYNMIVSLCVGSLFWFIGPILSSYTVPMRPAPDGLSVLPRS